MVFAMLLTCLSCRVILSRTVHCLGRKQPLIQRQPKAAAGIISFDSRATSTWAWQRNFAGAFALLTFLLVLPTTQCASDPVGTTWPGGTTQHCTGDDLKSRTCQFSNIAYDKRGKTFYYHTTAEELKQLGLQAGIKYKEYIRLGLGAYQAEDAFHIAFLTTPLPAAEQACLSEEPVYLHNPYHGNCFGHILRDSFHNIVDNLHRLGLEHRRYKLTLASSYVSTVLHKYAVYVATGVNTWAQETGRCNKQFIVFKDLVAGNGLLRDLRSEELPKEMCAAEYFMRQRDMAFRMNSLPAVGSVDPNRIKVLICDKETRDKRRINNVAELLPALQQRFPDYVIEAKILSQLDPRSQLAVLSTTTIFVAPIGSASFRLIYLPSGAHTILVGAPERNDGRPSRSFREADACWDNMGYVHIDRYQLTEPDEAVARYQRSKWASQVELYKQFLWWDSDSHLNATKLGNLIEEAVVSVRGAQATR